MFFYNRIVFILFIALGTSVPAHLQAEPCSRNAQRELLQFTNQLRQLHGLPELFLSRELERSAIERAEILRRRQHLSHEGWIAVLDRSGFDPKQYAAENIASGYRSPLAVLHGWYGSTGHRRNLLKPRYRLMGVGCVRDESGKRWWVQHLGSMG